MGEGLLYDTEHRFYEEIIDVSFYYIPVSIKF